MRRVNTVLHVSFLCAALLLISVGPSLAGEPVEKAEATEETQQCTVPEVDQQTPLEKIVGIPTPIHICRTNEPCETDWDCRDMSTGKIVLGWCRTLGDSSYCVCP